MMIAEGTVRNETILGVLLNLSQQELLPDCSSSGGSCRQVEVVVDFVGT